MLVDQLRAAELAVLGLGTTTGRPPLIIEAAVYHLRGAQVTGGPFAYWAAPDAPAQVVPVRFVRNLRLAPPWAEVAERLTDVLAGRILVMHEPDRLDILRRHLPDWRPARVLLTREMAQLLWPGLDDHGLGALTNRVTDRRLTQVGPGAAAEAQAIVLLLGALLHAADHPAPQPLDLDCPTGQD